MNFAEKIHDLYERFGELEGISVECQKELIAIGVVNKAARAEVFLQGAQITGYQRHGEAPVLFLSEACEYKAGSPLRGGIPICWPWFGDLKKNNERIKAQYDTSFMDSAIAHGFIRSCEWCLRDINLISDVQTALIFEYSVEKNNALNWPFSATLVYEVNVGEELTASLSIKNTDAKAFVFSAALHSYFLVDDIEKVSITGLGGCDYIDALNNWVVSSQEGEVNFENEVDRIYSLVSDTATLKLMDGGRRLSVNSRGSRSVVVWNPWIRKSQTLSQFFDDDYKKMVCIETANAGDDVIQIEPGEVHTLSVDIA